MHRTFTAYTAAAASVEVGIDGDGQPTQRIQLLPVGRIELRDGRGPYRLDQGDAGRVIDATRQLLGRQDMVVDYDHQHFFGVKDGVGAQAPAAGWIKPDSIRAEADGIWADVAWTPAAQAKLAAREYRYVSPLFHFDPKTMAVVAIANASLTNVPAIESLAAAATATTKEPTNMTYAKIAAALGLAEDATEDDIMAKIAAMIEGAQPAAAAAAAQTALAAAAGRFGLAATATVDELIAAAAAKPDPAKFVPADALADLQKTVSALADGKAEGVVAAAMAEGKVAPALKDWALDYAKRDLPGFQGWLGKAPVILDPAKVIDTVAAAAGQDGLTEAERSAAKMLGLTAEQFLKTKKG